VTPAERRRGLRRLDPADVEPLRRDPVDRAILPEVARIVEDVRARGDAALRAHALRLDDLAGDAPLVLERDALERALAELVPRERELLERTRERIEAFARAQLDALGEVCVPIPGGRAGHVLAPVERAGCYAPGGRFPLPSSVLMTAVPARVAGVREVWVASPRPAPGTLAAAAVAGADRLLAVGGAQAVAALAHGTESVPAVDVVVGPGNRWVTAAKQLVAGTVGIDFLAGPSELVVIADGAADPARVAADLLAQAEHDPDALPVLIATDAGLADAVDRELERQRAGLDARVLDRSLARGYGVIAGDLAEAARLADRLAPEHLALHVAQPEALARWLRHYGALFVGGGAAEVLGDYGAGPNHVLPTGGAARYTGGLSVLDFLRLRTWLRIDDADAARGLYADAAALGRLEGLEAHARSAELRLERDG